MDDWPGEERRRPRLSTPQWAVRAPLAAWLEQQARRGRRRATACSTSAAARSRTTRSSPSGRAEYIGVDVVPQPAAELVGRVEELPVEDGSFDLVLCTQVLEHCDDPVRAVARAAPGDRAGRPRARVHARRPGLPPLAGGLLALDPRGARAPLHRERRVGSVEVTPGGGHRDMSCDAARDLHRDRPAAHRACARAGVAAQPDGAALDARFDSLREPRPGSLTANFHLVATVAGAS